jgi:hypothetical protein
MLAKLTNFTKMNKKSKLVLKEKKWLNISKILSLNFNERMGKRLKWDGLKKI